MTPDVSLNSASPPTKTGLLNTPLWPHSGLELTTPRTFLFMGISILLGIVCYLLDYTFDGGLLIYLAVVILFSRAYYARAYKWLAYFINVVILIPPGNYFQNKVIETGQMTWKDGAKYLFGRVTAEGDGPFKWTRFIYTGQEQPSIDGSVDHLMLAYMYSTANVMFVHALPARFKRLHRPSQIIFYSVFAATSGVFALLPVLFPLKTGRLDWWWPMTSMSFILSWAGILFSKTFRKLAATQANLLGTFFMTVFIGPIFDAGVHVCANHDYLMPSATNMPPMLVCGDHSVPWMAPFYYAGYAVMYPAMLCLLEDVLRKWIVKDGRYTFGGELRAAEEQS